MIKLSGVKAIKSFKCHDGSYGVVTIGEQLASYNFVAEFPTLEEAEKAVQALLKFKSEGRAEVSACELGNREQGLVLLPTPYSLFPKKE